MQQDQTFSAMKIYYAHSHFFMKLLTLLQRIHFPSCSQFVHIILLPIPRSEEIFYTSFKDSKKEQPLDNAAWRFATAITESLGKTERCAKNNPVQPGLLAICYMGKRTKKKKMKKEQLFYQHPLTMKNKQSKRLFSLDRPFPIPAEFVFLQSFLFIFIYLCIFFKPGSLQVNFPESTGGCSVLTKATPAGGQAVYRLLMHGSKAHACPTHPSATQPHGSLFSFGALYLPFPFCHAVYQDKLRKVVMKTNTVATVPFRSLISLQHHTWLRSVSDKDRSCWACCNQVSSGPPAAARPTQSRALTYQRCHKSIHSTLL